MKRITYLSLFSFFLLMAACENRLADDDGDSSQDITAVLSEEGATWRVSYFWDKDKDETSDFRAYSFKFESDGKLEIKNGDQIISGSWGLGNDDSRSKFIINAGTQAKPLSELSDDWIILEKGPAVIKLKDDNDEHLEELHFSKI